MTLHWWMHWFWVTAQLAGLLLASPLPSTTQDPRIELKAETSTSGVSIMEARIERVSRIDPRVVANESLGATSSGTGGREEQGDKPEQLFNASRGIPTSASFRVAKAISSYDAPTKTNTALANNNNNNNRRQVDEAVTESTTSRKVASMIEPSSENVHRARQAPNNYLKRDDSPNVTRPESSSNSQHPDSQITWLLTTSKTPERRKKKNDNLTSRSDMLRNFSSKSHDQENKDLTVLPLRFEGTRIKLVVNSTRTITTGNRLNFTTRTFNGSEDIEIDQELAEPRLAATAASVLQDFLTAGIASESTRLSRARNAFSSDFQRDHREEDRASDINVSQVLLEANESVNREIETSSSPSVVDIAAITGSCLATIVLLSTMGSLGFIMYRRKYLNPPQTLNSDKCSNPDSSGYIDDSTIRDNSEEMYSLDNDSFLNSLEAMTIQNYWTDSVKHTKL